MIYIKPVLITPARLVSTTVTGDSDPAPWNAITVYAVDALVRRDETHQIYKCKVAGASAVPPENDLAGTAPKWVALMPTNAWACFDSAVNTQSVQDDGDMVIAVAPGEIVDSLTLMEAEADAVSVVVTDGIGGPVVFTRDVSMITSEVNDAFEYCFAPFTRDSILVLRDLPPYLNAVITVTLRGTSPVKLGSFSVGLGYFIGATQYGARAGVIDKSKKDEDPDTGVIKLKPGPYRKTMTVTLNLDDGAANKVHQLMTDARGQVGVWLGAEKKANTLQAFVVSGFPSDFYCVLPKPTLSVYSIEIQGMT